METYADILKKNLEIKNDTENIDEQYIKYKRFLESSENIKKCSVDNGLEMYCYVKCDNTDSLATKFARGVVYKGDKMVASSLPYTVQFACTENEEIQQFLDGIDIESIQAFPAYEGTLIRMFYVDEKWYISTHRKFDAFKCTWGPSKKSFGDTFVEALKNTEYSSDNSPDKDIIEKLCENLDTSNVYLFLVLSTIENRLVCDPKPPTVYFVGNIKENTTLYYEGVKGIPSVPQLKFSSIDELIKVAENTDYHTGQGVILYLPNMVQVKIINYEYLSKFNLRNNEPSLNYRYLQLKDRPHLQQEFRELYPEHLESFDKYDGYIDKICRELLKLYKSRYIDKKFIQVVPQKHWVLKKCHEKSEEGMRVDIELIKSVLFLQAPSVINKFVREIRFENSN